MGCVALFVQLQSTAKDKESLLPAQLPVCGSNSHGTFGVAVGGRTKSHGFFVPAEYSVYGNVFAPSHAYIR